MKFTFSALLALSLLSFGCTKNTGNSISSNEKAALFDSLIMGKYNPREATIADNCLTDKIEYTNVKKDPQGRLTADLKVEDKRLEHFMLAGSSAFNTPEKCAEFNKLFAKEAKKDKEYQTFSNVQLTIDTVSHKRVGQPRDVATKK